uniref:protein NRT1/ PTR FAMILY 2.5-like n=1 Tax=Fragaria vesca subsp. vesca TaxID=101020 RepID=UPI0005CB2731|nr:PREDICTED: protein NRT1/ PTR FAMILY 2.5-like [Fragaria vesca subsp. vesca]
MEVEGKLSTQSTSKEEQGEVHRACDENGDSKGGGWTTFPFVIATVLGLSVAGGGWASNLIVFLITKFNVKTIAATKINNIILGTNNLFPIAGAFIADSFFTSFSVVGVFSFISLLGMIMLTIIVTIPSLMPSPCSIGSLITCQAPSKFQYSVLYAVLSLASLGLGGTRFTIATMGADQFNDPNDQGIFFNWYFLALYVANIFSFTAIIYIQDNVGWGLGFGICCIANGVGLVVFLLGKRFYKKVKPKGSPFLSIARVLVAAIWKRKMSSANSTENDYYYYGAGVLADSAPPTKSFRFLNCAALKIEQVKQFEGSHGNSWTLCTVREVEDSNIQALYHQSTECIDVVFHEDQSVANFDKNILENAERLTYDSSPLQEESNKPQEMVNEDVPDTAEPEAAGAANDDQENQVQDDHDQGEPNHEEPNQEQQQENAQAPLRRSHRIERKRLGVVRAHSLMNQPGSVVPMSAFWLVAQLSLIGIAEGFHFPGQVSLCYQEFPKSLRSTSTAMISLLIGIGYYLSTAVTDLVDRTTNWLPDDINQGRLDNVFWMLVVICVVNFGYFITCAKFFVYQNQNVGK